MADTTQEIVLTHSDDLLALFGAGEQHLKRLEQDMRVVIHAVNERVQVVGDETAVADTCAILYALLALVARGHMILTSDVVTAITMSRNGELDRFVSLYEEEIIRDSLGTPIRIKTLGQKVYVEAIQQNDVIFGLGPAGTGKTFLAVTLAVKALKRGEVKRIVLTRPAVEAGESLGFLPGDLKEKVDPYLRPVYDALYRILGKE